MSCQLKMTVEGSSGMVTTVTSRGGDDGRATSVVLEATRLHGDSRLPCCDVVSVHCSATVKGVSTTAFTPTGVSRVGAISSSSGRVRTCSYTGWPSPTLLKARRLITYSVFGSEEMEICHRYIKHNIMSEEIVTL
ncbi:hypothetical protein E2C01_021203 [Portunus trituberculatus]|uniref:Uncharacterized protein n=1 Tax=Portunus trituberculatus TaxID=210409 RepID=A0A5B7E205_PORTR|nr:hypothetical protein [Portunus trituberculatus]